MFRAPCTAKCIRRAIPIGTVLVSVAYIRIKIATALIFSGIVRMTQITFYNMVYHPLIVLTALLVYSPSDISETPGNEWQASASKQCLRRHTSLNSSYATNPNANVILSLYIPR